MLKIGQFSQISTFQVNITLYYAFPAFSASPYQTTKIRLIHQSYTNRVNPWGALLCVHLHNFRVQNKKKHLFFVCLKGFVFSTGNSQFNIPYLQILWYICKTARFNQIWGFKVKSNLYYAFQEISACCY